MVAGISFGGLASGLDTDAIISALVAVEQRPIALMQSQQTGYRDQISAFDKLKELLEALNTAVEPLGDPNEFLAFKATSSDDSTVSVETTGGETPAGEYDVNVSQLAESTLLRTASFSDPSDSTGQGTITVTVGGVDHDIVIDGANDNFSEVQDEIDAIDGVSAYIVFDGTNHHLEIRGDDTGTANEVSISEDLSSFSVLAPIVSARDAQFTVNGLDFTSVDNLVEDAIPGLAISLNAVHADAGETATITVEEDFEAIETQLQAFVDAYNGLVDFFDEQRQFTVAEEGEASESAPLFGDLSLRMLQSNLSQAVMTFADETEGLAVNSLASIGITTGSDGKLTLDSEKLQETLTGNLESVQTLFTDPDSGEDGDFVGIARKLEELIEFRTELDGVIQTRKDSLNQLIDNLDDRIRTAEGRLVTFEESLVRRFASFETLIGQLQAQGSALTAFTA